MAVTVVRPLDELFPGKTGELPELPSTDLPERVIWQLADSALPAGGFAHSGGLEAAWQQGEIRSAAALSGFLEASLVQARHGLLPYVHLAHRHPGRLAEWDAHCDLWLSNHVARLASRLQGRAYWTATTRVFFPEPTPAPEPGHLPPLFGWITRQLGLPLDRAARLFLFMHLRGLVSAAVRLNIIGPLEAQAVQYRLGPVMERLAPDGLDLTLDDLAQTSPLLDVWQGAQDRLYSRLFQS